MQMLRRPVEPKLHAAVGMVNEAAARHRTTVMQRLLQGVENEARLRRARHPPADDPPGEGVDHEGDIDEPLPGRNVREVPLRVS
jgi:hypothetical protein